MIQTTTSAQRYAVRLHGLNAKGARVTVVTDDVDLVATLREQESAGVDIKAAEFRRYVPQASTVALRERLAATR
jgi:hypothetical protein